MFQIELTLVPAPMKIAAEASATKASNNVYSIRSWPFSSLMKFRNIVVFAPWLRFRVPQVTKFGIGDFAVACGSAALSGSGELFTLAGPRSAEDDGGAIVVDHAPARGFFQCA